MTTLKYVTRIIGTRQSHPLRAAIFFSLTLSMALLQLACSGQTASDDFSPPPPVAPSELVTARLIADVDTIEAGVPFHIGVVFQIAPRSHIYWRNPGSSGLLSGVDWSLPEGFLVGELKWPAPERFEIEGIDDINFGYKNEVLLYAEVTPPATLDPSLTIRLAARPYWLNCQDDGMCIPGDADVSLEMRAGDASPSLEFETFDKYRATTPVDLADSGAPLTVNPSADRAGFMVIFHPPWTIDLTSVEERLIFFPEEGEEWEMVIRITAGDTGVSGIRFRAEKEVPSSIAGVLVVRMHRKETREEQVYYLNIRA